MSAHRDRWGASDRPVAGAIHRRSVRLLLESGPVRLRPTLRRRAAWFGSVLAGFVALSPGIALAQAGPDYTPQTSITPTKIVQPWIYQMAIGAVILGLVVIVGVAASYLRYSPRFFGREEPPKHLPPGARPPLLSRQAISRPQASATVAVASAASPGAARPAAGTATAVAERLPVARQAEAPPPPPPQASLL
jgi:hypothetical protein